MTATALEIEGGVAACYAKLGRLDEAYRAVARGCEVFRTSRVKARFDTEHWREFWKRVVPVRDFALFEELLAALELSGLPAALARVEPGP